MKFAFLAILALSLLAGCATTGGGRADQVQEVHLFGMPAALNMDGRPGADGFAVRVYIIKPGSVKGAQIGSGSIEVLMFDGVVGVNDMTSVPPAQTWRFARRELAPLEEQTSLGFGYRFTLRWNAKPNQGHITLVARHVPTKGDVVYSAPSTIPSATK